MSENAAATNIASVRVPRIFMVTPAADGRDEFMDYYTVAQ
jgi:hypothetical protein